MRVILGSRNNDEIYGTARNDVIHSGRGDDVIHGGSGNDRLAGGDGNDRIDGGTGNDRLAGDAGDDLLLGQAGNDTLDGGAGNDLLDGGLGSDEIDAGSGNDTVVFVFSERGSSFDELAGGSGIDTLRLVFSEAEWARADIRARVAALDAFIDANTGRSGQANSHTFESALLGFSAQQFERLEVVVLHQNHAPVLESDFTTTLEDEPVRIAVLANDIDPDGDALTVTSATAAQGTVVINADGTLTYLADANYNGSDFITYTVSDGTVTQVATVTVTIAPVKDGPVLENDVATLLEDSFVIITPLANDSHPDGDLLTVTGATANHGSIIISPDGRQLFYVGDFNYSGADLITYTVSDGAVTRTATVAVTITPTNDGPLPQNDSATALEDQPVTIAVLANDIDPDGDRLTVTAATAHHGSVVVNADGTLTYQGDANYNGSDVILYEASDGILTRTAGVLVTITAVNDAPLPQNDAATLLEDSSVIITPLANDSDPDRDSLIVTSATANHGSVIIGPDGTRLAYSGDANYNGADLITYTVSDGALTRTATIAVTVTPVNDAPLLQFDSVTTLEDQPVTIAVLANDIDVEGDPLTIVQAVAERGTVTINADGTLTYVPRADYFGTDFVTYAVSDGTVTRFQDAMIQIAPVHDAPILHDDTATVVEDHSVNIHVLDNDIFPEHEFPAAIGATAEHGTVTVSAQGTVIYTGAADFFGTDVVTYTVFDGTVTRSATVAVTVLPENDAPTGIALSHAAFNEDTPGAPVGLLSAVDPEGGVTFSVSDPRFEVVGNVLKLRDGIAIDREQLPGGKLIMLATATDDGGLRTFADIHLVVNDVDEGTTISGFNAAGGAVLDFDAVMTGGMRNLFGWNVIANPFGTEPGGGFLHLRQDGSDALLEFDNNGGGDDFVPLVRFEDADIHDFTAANFFPGRDWQI